MSSRSCGSALLDWHESDFWDWQPPIWWDSVDSNPRVTAMHFARRLASANPYLNLVGTSPSSAPVGYCYRANVYVVGS